MEVVILVLLGILIFAIAKASGRGGRQASTRPEFDQQTATPREREGVPVRPATRSSDASAVAPGPDQLWISAGRAIEIAGYAIPGGMLYSGERLPSAGGTGSYEPALIDPRLNVDRGNPDRAGTGMTYWPSYSEILPSCRAAYLEWLAAGRANPQAYIGYVFLYFYGLERRALIDARVSSAAREEIPTITREVERLLSIYSANGSFAGYATRFLDAMRLRHPPERSYEASPPTLRFGWELPPTVRLAIGQLAVEEKPVPGNWAFAWVLLHPETRLRTVAERCSGELEELFLSRYRARFGEGIKLRPTKTQIELEYTAASLSLPRPLHMLLGELPDIAAQAAPVTQLRDVFEECVDALEPYSRLIGREPNARKSLTAVATLPPDLTASAMDAEALALEKWIRESIREAAHISIHGAELAKQWPGQEPTPGPRPVGAPSSGDMPSGGPKSSRGEAGLTRKDTILLGQFLERIGFGIEPDPRFDGPALKADEPAVLFRLSTTAPKVPSPQYQASTVLLHLGAAIANADGTVEATERALLLSHIENAMHLSESERERLQAHMAWLIASEAGVTRLKKRVESLAKTQRQALAAFCISVAGSDGRIEPEEIRTLSKIYKVLGFPPDVLHGEIHALMSTASTEVPVTVREAAQGRAGVVIPPQSEVRQALENGVTLDMKAVRAKIEETAAVSALLSSIFVEDVPVAETPTAASIGERLGPLDPSHSQLLRALLVKGQLGRSEFDELARALGLLPDGAIEKINDVAFDLCGGPLCEGEDPVLVDVSLAKGLFG